MFTQCPSLSMTCCWSSVPSPARPPGLTKPVALHKRQGEWVVTVIDNCGQATKGVWWMPWHREATKDVVACDMLREAGKQALIRRFLNEETQPINNRLSSSEFIAG